MGCALQSYVCWFSFVVVIAPFLNVIILCPTFSINAAGLPDLWCDDPVGCPFKAMYDNSYSFMSKADFWVAAANAVISHTSNNQLQLPFRWGRTDATSCTSSSARLPEPHGCSEVEATFLNRMGLSWRDATALMGAHTLGRGDIRFSGHDGTWVDNDLESTVFDKRFYEETLRRAWRPRQTAAGVNWTWGGNNRGVMMLNTDICLFYDIPEGNNQDCCTDTTGNCRDNTVQNSQCPTAENVRPEAFAAFNEFLGGPITNLNNNNNEPFYAAFLTAWTTATELGYSENELSVLENTCDPTAPTTPAPVPITPAPVPATLAPVPITPAPVPSTLAPVPSPVSAPVPAPSTECEDFDGVFQVTKNDGSLKDMTCDQINVDKCTKHGHLCRNTCGSCECLLTKMICTSDADCCSNKCNAKGRCSDVMSSYITV